MTLADLKLTNPRLAAAVERVGRASMSGVITDSETGQESTIEQIAARLLAADATLTADYKPLVRPNGSDKFHDSRGVQYPSGLSEDEFNQLSPQTRNKWVLQTDAEIAKNAKPDPNALKPGISPNTMKLPPGVSEADFYALPPNVRLKWANGGDVASIKSYLAMMGK